MNNFFSKLKRRVLLIYTGGTIGMIRNPETGALETFNFDHLMKHVPELKEFDYVIKSYQFDPPIDSSDMQPELWAKLVNIIDYNYQQYDAWYGHDGLHCFGTEFYVGELRKACGTDG